MKYFLLIASLFLFNHLAAQITPEQRADIKAKAEAETQQFKKTLTGWADMDMAYAVDTFRIQRIMDKTIDADYSTHGMNNAVNELTASYDKLLNKYYKLIMGKLSTVDKQVFLKAQKAWLAFRKAEEELILVLSKDQYSGGGTIQSNIITDSFSGLIVRRTDELFRYYSNMYGQ